MSEFTAGLVWGAAIVAWAEAIRRFVYATNVRPRLEQSLRSATAAMTACDECAASARTSDQGMRGR